MCLINQLDREAKQVEVTAKINEKEVPRGVVTGIELVSPSSDNLPEQSDFMSTEYKLKAITKDVEDSSQVKWCYAVLTDSEYRGKIKVSQVSESLSQTGEEIAFKPENILSESSKKKLSNKDVSAKLYIFAYMKSPAYYTKHGQTHVKCGIKKDLSNIQISDKDWHDPLEKMQIAIFMQRGGYAPYWAGFGYVRNGSIHQGIDLFAIPGTNVYACLEGTIYSMSELRGYGKTIILEITSDTAINILKKRKEIINYKLLYPKIKHTVNYSIIDGEQECGANYNENSNVFYIYYAHLDEYATDLSVGSKVKAGDIIGTTGTTGIDETKTKHKGPHLHFEITTQVAKGLTGRINPSFFVQYDIPTNIKYAYDSCVDYNIIKKNIGDYLPTYSKQLEYRENNK